MSDLLFIIAAVLLIGNAIKGPALFSIGIAALATAFAVDAFRHLV